jgi:hypothetical protein
MKLIAKIAISAAFMAMASTQAAMADLAPRQVWDDWKAYFTGLGYTITGAEQEADRALFLQDLTLTIALPDSAGTVAAQLGDVQFQAQSDGSVAVVFPAEIPVRFAMVGTDGAQLRGTIVNRQTLFSLIVSGTPEKMAYSYSAAQVQMALDSLIIDDLAMQTADTGLTLRDVSGRGTSEGRSLTQSQQQLQIAQLDYAIALSAPKGPNNSIDMRGTLQDVSQQSLTAMPQSADRTDFEGMLQAGLAIETQLRYGVGESSWSFVEEGARVTAEGTSSMGQFSGALSSRQLAYSGSATQQYTVLTGTELPLPVEFWSDKTGFEITIPTAISMLPQPFSLGVTLQGVRVSEVLWAMLDPLKKLPRDPANLSVQLAGTARVDSNPWDPEAMLAQDSPFLPQTLDLRALTLSAAGATLKAQGGFSFDGDDLQTFPGMPRPEGMLNVTISGAQTLLETLVEIGLVPQEQAMGVLMMLGIFTVPGTAEGQLTSQLEINAQGHVLANGQRLR